MMTLPDRFGPLALALSLAVGVAPALAHHSMSGYVKTNASLTGVVREFRFINPHPVLILQVAGQAGEETWAVELDERNEFEPLGMRSDTYRPGDRLIVTGWPGRQGAKTMYMRRLERPADGLIWEQVGNDPRLVSPGNLRR